MKINTFILLTLFSGGWTWSSAQAESADSRRPNTVELSADSQRLSNGRPDWSEHALRWSRWLGQRQQLDITLLQARRFGLQDEQILASYTAPLAGKLGATLDAGLSPTHNFMARHSLGLTLQYEFASGWLAYGGMKNTAYDSGSVEQATLMLEHYVSSFSWAAAWRPVRAFATSTHSSELRGSYYYGDKNFIGISWASGQEVTPVSGSALVLADIWSVALTGRHWLHQNWAVNYALNSTRQGSYYNRDGVRIGVQYIF